jgi:hypothetical protein
VCDVKNSKWVPESIREAVTANGGSLIYETEFSEAEKKVFRKGANNQLKKQEIEK